MPSCLTADPHGLALRLLARVEQGETRHAELGACHVWAGGHNDRGYGYLSVGGRNVRVHRLSWELFVGPIPAGMEIRHQCDVPLCVHISHLLLGTHKQNMQDMSARGRAGGPRGEVHYRCQLTDFQIELLRDSYEAGVHYADLAEQFSISRSYAWALATGRKRPRHTQPVEELMEVAI